MQVREISPSFPQLLQVAPVEANIGGRPVGSINEANKDLEHRKVMNTDLITRADAARKHIVKFDKRQEKDEALISKAKEEENYSVAKLKIWCSLQ